MFAYLILLIGIVLLLQNLGIITGSFWGIFWPCLLIIAGLAMIFRRNECCGWSGFREFRSIRREDRK